MTVTEWIPLIPCMLIEAGEVQQFFIQNKELAVWRSMQGHVQIWENRCPHRSVRLSLGQVQGESLVCAYHGWQFAAEDGHCQRIPAQPEQRAPKSLCVQSYAVQEHAGMIWFGGVSALPPLPLLEDASHQVYAGSVTLSTTLAQLHTYLLQLGFEQSVEHRAGWVWKEMTQSSPLFVYLTPVQNDLITVHALLIQAEQAVAMHPVLKQMRHFFEQEQWNYV